MNLALHTGNQALTYIRTEEFQLKWKALHERCPYVTACQHPDFVTPWYELYKERFLPVIVVAEAEDKSLSGLLTLALCKNGKKLVGAGERQAEYQCWLEARVTGNAFIQEAVQKIRSHFPGADLYLRYLPPGIPLNWILDNREHAEIFSVRSHPRPLMKIDEATTNSQCSKKKYRRNVSQLKKSGHVQFEKITGHDQFIGVFDELCIQYDFRQGALYRHMPFSHDPAKKLFYVELHKRGLLHTTILTVDGKIAASHSGLMSKESVVHLGINTYGPTFAAHSPGKLLLSMLGAQLVKEKITVLDLTPGGDGYKENFATDHDVVFELTAYGDVKTRLAKEALWGAKRFLKRGLQQAGMRTADVWTAIGKLTRFSEIGFSGSLELLRTRTVSSPRVYQLRAGPPFTHTPALPISKDCLTDMFQFDSRGFLISRWEFLRMAMERLEKSNHLYSFTRNGKLLMCCWLDVRAAGLIPKLPDQNATFSENTVVLFDLHVHRELKENELVERFIKQILFELRDCHNNKNIYFSGALSNELQAVIEQCGFDDLTDKRDELPSVIAPRKQAKLFSKGIKWIQQ